MGYHHVRAGVAGLSELAAQGLAPAERRATLQALVQMFSKSANQLVFSIQTNTPGTRLPALLLLDAPRARRAGGAGVGVEAEQRDRDGEVVHEVAAEGADVRLAGQSLGPRREGVGDGEPHDRGRVPGGVAPCMGGM